MWVIDPVSKETWSRSLKDTSSGLSSSEIDSLSSTNTESYQDGNTLFVVGGYVYTNKNFTTYNALTAIDLPALVDWVKGTDQTLHANTILQVAGEESSDSSYDGGFFQVTGGGLEKQETAINLFGQKFEGPCTRINNFSSLHFTGSKFNIDYDFATGTLRILILMLLLPVATQAGFVADLNVFPILHPTVGGSTKNRCVSWCLLQRRWCVDCAI